MMIIKIYHSICSYLKKAVENPHQFYLVFTGLFSIIFILAYCWFLVYGKSFIWQDDGLKQHFIALAYWGNYLRSAVSSILSGNFNLPLWDFNIGYGSDIIQTLSFYVIGDPLALGAVFVPERFTEYLYNFLVILRIYLCGIAFLHYCKSIEIECFYALCGSFIYMFCGFTIGSATRHPFFMNAMIFLPLILHGIERIIKKEKPYLFIFSVAAACLCNFYFFYMIVILTAIYVLVRFYSILLKDGKHQFKALLFSVGKIALFGVIGVLLAAPVFLPSILAAFQTSRLNSHQTTPLFYNMDYYRTLPASFISYVQAGNWTLLSFSAVALLCIVVMFTKKKKYLEVKLAFIILSVMHLLPLFGSVLNGFSYVSNRWNFGYAFVIAMITTNAIPELLSLNKYTKIKLLTFAICYLIPIILTPNNSFITIVVVSGMFCFVVICILFLDKYIQKNAYAVLIIILAGIIVNYASAYSPFGGDNVSEYVPANTAYHRIKNESPVLKIDQEFSRIETQSSFANNAMLNRQRGVGFFFSVSNSNVDNFLTQLCLNYETPYNYKNLDNRTALALLAGVKYESVKSTQYLPFSYDHKVSENVFSTEMYLPFGYTYSGFAPEETFSKLSPLQKREALLNIACVDQKISCLPEMAPVFIQEEIDIVLKEQNNAVNIEFSGLKNSETYLYIKNLKLENGLPNIDRVKVTAATDTVEKNQFLYASGHQYYMGKNDFLFNMGYSGNAQNSISIMFHTTSKISYESIQVFCLPIDKIEHDANNLQAESLQNIVMDNNKITGDIHVDGPKLLFLNMPYSNGWKAYVNGRKTALLKVNYMFSGLVLGDGKSEIELVYCTPGLIAGWICCGIGIAVILFFAVNTQRRKKAKLREPSVLQ